MDNFIEFARGFDLQMIVGLVAIGWLFSRNIKKEFNSRLDKLEQKVTDIDRRLCRIEGAMTTKKCCVLTDARQEKKK